MKTLNEYKADIFLSSEKKIKQSRKKKGYIAAFSVSLCIALTVLTVNSILPLKPSAIPENNVTDNRIVITATDDIPSYTGWASGISDLGEDWMPSKDTVMISDKLKKQMGIYKGKDVYYRVVVCIYRVIEDEGSDCIEKRSEYIKSVGALNVTDILDTSDIYAPIDMPTGRAFVMELNEDMINKMVDKGGYSFHLAPPARKDGYDRKITDSLTVELDSAKDGELMQVAVMTVIDKGNYYANSRDYFVRRSFSSDLYSAEKEKEFFSYKEGTQLIRDGYDENKVKNYIAQILKRNNLTDKRVITQSDVDCGVYGEYFVSTELGFEVKITKSEIIALAKDGDVKAICLAKTNKIDFVHPELKGIAGEKV